uniref:Secreted protein n=1 Tax=Heterorhabditis bacteriophora TaxID=37862 RepID=A0A1I7WBL8_HETBA
MYKTTSIVWNVFSVIGVVDLVFVATRMIRKDFSNVFEHHLAPLDAALSRRGLYVDSLMSLAVKPSSLCKYSASLD